MTGAQQDECRNNLRARTYGTATASWDGMLVGLESCTHEASTRRMQPYELFLWDSNFLLLTVQIQRFWTVTILGTGGCTLAPLGSKLTSIREMLRPV